MPEPCLHRTMLADMSSSPDSASQPLPGQTVGGHARITTLSLVDEASITRKAPLYDPAKGIANHKTFLRYVRQAYEGATPQTFVDAGLGQPTDKDDLMNDVWSRYADENMAPGALAGDTTMALTPADGMSKADLMLIDLENRLTPAKSGVRINRWGGARRVDIRNASDALAMHTLREDFKQHVRASGAEASVLSEDVIDQFFREQLGDSRLLTPKKIDTYFPIDYSRFNLLSPSTRELIASAIGADPASIVEPRDARLVQSIDDALKGLGIETTSAAAPGGEAPARSLSSALAAATPAQLARAIKALETEGSSINQKHYAPNLQRVMLSRSYNTFMHDTMDRILDVQQQRRYERAMDDRDSATVYQQKKHVPESHLNAADQSVFARSGDFAHVEIDESVELELMARIEAEWKVLREALPHSEQKADLRFRKTGRHKAAGVYHPTLQNMAVDPRHPSSFVHEYFHHLDYTLGADADTKQLSLAEDFAVLLHGVQRNMRAAGGIDKLDYYTTPTEVFARGGELVCYWSGLATSLNGDAAKYDSPVYRSFEPYREQLIEWYNKRLGLDIAHERALPTPAEAGRPTLSSLGDAEPLAVDAHTGHNASGALGH